MAEVKDLIKRTKMLQEQLYRQGSIDGLTELKKKILEDSDVNELDEIKSINKVLSFPKNFNIYPGHGEKTMVGEELRLWGIE